MTEHTLDDIHGTDIGADGAERWVRASIYSPQFHARIAEQLDQLAKLPENWDGEKARPISAPVLEAARAFAEMLPDDVAPVPSVVPIPSGNLQFEWHEGTCTLEMEFESPTTIRYLKWHPEAGVEEEDSFSTDDRQTATTLLRWFLRSGSNA